MNSKKDMRQMEANAEEAARFLKSIANGVRLRILCRLLEGEMTAGDLSRELGITPANLSQHLVWLKKEGLLESRREGTVIHYRMAGNRIEPLMNVLHEMFCGLNLSE